MNILWKGVAALSLAVAGLTAAVPAQAQYHGGRHDGWRGDRGDRFDNGRRDHRRWDNRRNWRGDRGNWRGHRGYRQRCWNEWRYDRYRHRDVRVRICR
ncbi:hypothetical protein [Sphingobium sp.]|uniref:hypothetical protein n=1 Tax=Sphingobium sp. TaxID=1912891 RepID=UPI003BB6E99D